MNMLRMIASSNGRWGPLTQRECEVWASAIRHDRCWTIVQRETGERPPKEFRIYRSTCKHGV